MLDFDAGRKGRRSDGARAWLVGCAALKQLGEPIILLERSNWGWRDLKLAARPYNHRQCNRLEDAAKRPPHRRVYQRSADPNASDQFIRQVAELFSCGSPAG